MDECNWAKFYRDMIQAETLADSWGHKPQKYIHIVSTRENSEVVIIYPDYCI